MSLACRLMLTDGWIDGCVTGEEKTDLAQTALCFASLLVAYSLLVVSTSHISQLVGRDPMVG